MSYNNVIIDGNNFLYRAVYARREPYLVDGFNVTPIHQFLYMLKSIREKFTGEIYFTWDKKIREDIPNFRKSLIEYKEQREENDITKYVYAACEVVIPIIEKLGINTVYPYSLEADDVIYSFAKNLKGKTIIVSSDRDLLQLITNDVHIYSPIEKIIIEPSNFEEHVDSKLENYVLYKSILGDVSDNMKGLYKYGPVKSKKLADEIFEYYTTVEQKSTPKEKILAFINASDPSIFDLSKDQFDIIVRNIKISWLNNWTYENLLPVDLQKLEEDSFNNQLKNTCMFDESYIESVFTKYGLKSFLSEFYVWKKLFKQNLTLKSTISVDDLLSFV